MNSFLPSSSSLKPMRADSVLPGSLNRLTALAPVLLAVPVGCMLVLLGIYTVDVPWIDDIDAFLSFLLGYTDAKTTGEKIDWLIRPNNEHRILTGKLITLGLYKLTGAVNFRWLIFAAFAFILGLLALLYRVFQSTRLPLLAFVPVALLLLQPQYYLTSMWAITGMQHEVVLALTFVSMYLLAGNTTGRFAGAMGVQILASLSMSNGLFGWVAGAVVLTMARQWGRLGIWLVVSVATIVFYFHDFPNGQGNETSITFFKQYPYLVFSGFFTFTGGLFDLFSWTPILWRSMLPTLAGMVGILAMLVLLWRMNEANIPWKSATQRTGSQTNNVLRRRRLFFTGAYAYLMVNAVAIAFLRPRFGYQVMLISNYMIYPAIFFALLYLNLLSESRTLVLARRWVGPGLVLSALLWVNWYAVRLPRIAYWKHHLLSCAYNQQHSGTGLGAQWGNAFARIAQNAIQESIRRGMYQYPQSYFTANAEALKTSYSLLPEAGFGFEVRPADNIFVARSAYNALPNPVGHGALIAQSDTRTYLFPSELRYTPANFYLNRPMRTVQAEIIAPIMAPGRYRLGVLSPEDPTQRVLFSTQTITVPE